MARPKGLPKTGGRQKGTSNLKTLVLRESLNRVGFDVVHELKNLYPQLEAETQAKVLLSFLPFLFPKPQTVHLANLRTYEMQQRAESAVFGNIDGGPVDEENSEF